MSSLAKKTVKSAAGTSSASVTAPLEHKRVARLAYSYWEARGRPDGSPEEDWFRAEEEIRRRKAAWVLVTNRRRPPVRISSQSLNSA